MFNIVNIDSILKTLIWNAGDNIVIWRIRVPNELQVAVSHRDLARNARPHGARFKSTLTIRSDPYARGSQFQTNCNLQFVRNYTRAAHNSERIVSGGSANTSLINHRNIAISEPIVSDGSER